MSSILNKVLVIEEESSYIQKLFYEMSGYQSLMKTIVSDLEGRYNMELFDKIKKDYLIAYNLYNLAFSDLCGRYFPENPLASIELSFADNTLYIKGAI